MSEFEREWIETKDLIECTVDPQSLIGRSVDILAGAVIIERYHQKLFNSSYEEKDFDRMAAIKKVLKTGKYQ